MVTQTVVITPEQKFPFKVISSHMDKGNPFDLKVMEDLSTGSLRYFVSISNKESVTGRVYDSIVLKTDSDIRPEIKIFVAAAFIDQQQTKKQ